MKCIIEYDVVFVVMLLTQCERTGSVENYAHDLMTNITDVTPTAMMGVRDTTNDVTNVQMQSQIAITVSGNNGLERQATGNASPLQDNAHATSPETDAETTEIRGVKQGQSQEIVSVGFNGLVDSDTGNTFTNSVLTDRNITPTSEAAQTEQNFLSEKSPNFDATTNNNDVTATSLLIAANRTSNDVTLIHESSSGSATETPSINTPNSGLVTHHLTSNVPKEIASHSTQGVYETTSYRENKVTQPSSNKVMSQPTSELATQPTTNTTSKLPKQVTTQLTKQIEAHTSSTTNRLTPNAWRAITEHKATLLWRDELAIGTTRGMESPPETAAVSDVTTTNSIESAPHAAIFTPTATQKAKTSKHPATRNDEKPNANLPFGRYPFDKSQRKVETRYTDMMKGNKTPQTSQEKTTVLLITSIVVIGLASTLVIVSVAYLDVAPTIRTWTTRRLTTRTSTCTVRSQRAYSSTSTSTRSWACRFRCYSKVLSCEDVMYLRLLWNHGVNLFAINTKDKICRQHTL